ncbi:MAG: hypothetical protein IPH05_18885 [Flavobacteriales bacterium]|nr:hypothetical protein [Flavobacteriales bacterium]
MAGYRPRPTTDFALARYNADGNLDNSFSVDGKVTTDVGLGGDLGNSVTASSRTGVS